MKNAIPDRVRVLAWSTSGGGVCAIALGLWGLWGWPAAALCVGAGLLVFGILTAVAAGAGRR